MSGDKSLHIDSALQQLLSKDTMQYPGDYAGFLEKLANHDRQNVLIDEVLEKNAVPAAFPAEGTWKRIIAAIWLARLRKAGILLLVAGFMGYGLHRMFTDKPATAGTKNTHTVEGNTFAGHGSGSPVQLAAKEHKKENSSSSYNPLYRNAAVTNTRRHGHNSSKTIRHAGVLNKANDNGSSSLPVHPGLVENKKLATEEFESGLTPRTFRQSTAKAFHGLGLLEAMPYEPVRDIKSRRLPGNFIPVYTGFILSVSMTGSMQSGRSEMLSNDPQKTNRNYEALSNNGRNETQVLNYGLSIDKNLFKGFGLSAGIQKLSIHQQQRTDFLLTEIPLVDMDTNIVGYIAIQPEHIQKEVNSTIEYLSVPLNLSYTFRVMRRTDIQLRFGGSMAMELSRRTEKFDYTSLQLEDYKSSGRRVSFNTIQYAMSFRRDISRRLLLGIGFERQVMYKLNALSDQTEKVGSRITNITVSLHCKL